MTSQASSLTGNDHAHPLTRLLAIPFLVVLVAAGCANPATRNADALADRAALDMGREGHWNALDMIRPVVTRIDNTENRSTAIEALTAEGNRSDGRILLRIRATVRSGYKNSSVHRTVRCYEYRLRGSVPSPRSVRCPDTTPLDVPPPTPPPTIPEGIDEALLRSLSALAADSDRQEVLTAVRSLAPDANILEVKERDGIIGVVLGNGLRECVSARIQGQDIQIWRVPPRSAQAGELGCLADNAIDGLGRPPEP